jgi:hypothetical protein
VFQFEPVGWLAPLPLRNLMDLMDLQSLDLYSALLLPRGVIRHLGWLAVCHKMMPLLRETLSYSLNNNRNQCEPKGEGRKAIRQLTLR